MPEAKLVPEACDGVSPFSPLSELSNRKTNRSLASEGIVGVLEAKDGSFVAFDMLAVASAAHLCQPPASNNESAIEKNIQRKILCEGMLLISILCRVG